jgi:hypothetical protein
LIENGNVSDDEGDETEADAGFENEKNAGRQDLRHDVAEAEGEEGGSAYVKIGAEMVEKTAEGTWHRVGKGRSQGIEEQGESEDEEKCPDDQEEKQRERAVDAIELFADTLIADA